MSNVIEREVQDGVAVIRINRPGARNAISRDVHRRLDDALAESDADPDIAAIVLTGSDPAFSAGVDVKELHADPAVARHIGPRRAPLISTLTPVIGAINGATYTGGLELALNCHWLIASERATFADTHAKLGLTPGWGLTVLLTEAVGSRRARQFITTCRPIDAATALAWGLVNEVVPHDSLLERASELGREVAANDTVAVQTIIRTLDEQRAHADEPLWRIEAHNWIDPATPGSGPTRG